MKRDVVTRFKEDLAPKRAKRPVKARRATPRTRKVDGELVARDDRDYERRVRPELLNRFPFCDVTAKLDPFGITVACKWRATEVHHRRERSSGGAHCLRNLLPCCAACHQWIHAHPAKARPLGLLIREGDADWDECGLPDSVEEEAR